LFIQSARGAHAGTESIAKATTQPSLPTSEVLPHPSPSPEPTADVKPETDAETIDRIASHASAGPSHQQHQQPVPLQWVETDDLGDSKRQLPQLPKPQMPNGVLHEPQGGSERPQGRLHQPQGGSKQPEDSPKIVQQDLQAPEDSFAKLEGDSAQAGPSGPSDVQPVDTVKQEAADLEQVHPQPLAASKYSHGYA